MHGAAKQSGLKLLIRTESGDIHDVRPARAAGPSRPIGAIASRTRNRAGYQTAIIPPVEAEPRSALPWLILQMRRLVESFVMIDPERRKLPLDRCDRNSAGPADLRSEKARGNAGHDNVGSESVEVGEVGAGGESGNLGIVPLDRKRNRSVAQHAEVVAVVRIFPDVFAVEHDVAAERLL